MHELVRQPRDPGAVVEVAVKPDFARAVVRAAIGPLHRKVEVAPHPLDVV